MSIKVDTSAFNSMCLDLAKITGAPMENVVKYEAGKVIEKAVALVPAASVSKIRSAVENRRFVRYPRGTGPLYFLENKLPDPLWAAIEAQEKASLQAKLKARGLAKQGFLLLARLFGIEVKAPGYAKGAVPSDGSTHDNSTVIERHSGTGYGLLVATSQPTLQVPFVGGARALQRAITGRVKYFKASLRKKVFDSVKAIARRYPGMRVS